MKEMDDHNRKMSSILEHEMIADLFKSGTDCLNKDFQGIYRQIPLLWLCFIWTSQNI
jgi:hypothetical protein